MPLWRDEASRAVRLNSNALQLTSHQMTSALTLGDITLGLALNAALGGGGHPIALLPCCHHIREASPAGVAKPVPRAF